MCWCRPMIRTPFCGRPECHAPGVERGAESGERQDKNGNTAIDYVSRVEPEMLASAVPQPPPIKSTRPAIQDLVVADIEARKQVGLKKYGTLLQAHNGRDALMDAYQEALDLCQYLRQAIEERKDVQHDHNCGNMGGGCDCGARN